MNNERFCIADVGKVGEDAQCLDELSPLRSRAAQIEAEHRSTASGQELCCERMVGMSRQLGVADRIDQRVRRQERDDGARVLDMARHPQRQRLDALQDLERHERRHARAEVAHTFASRAQQKRGGRRFFGEHHVMKSGVRLGQRRKLAVCRLRSPVELPRIDEQAADHDAVTGQELGRRVIYDVGAQRERLHQIRRGERRIDQQRQPMVVRQRGNARNIEHVETGIAQRFSE